MLGIGIDTGGTCTDAIIYELESQKILAFGKSGTTHEKLEIGIRESVKKLPRELVDQASYISLSTTLATNACVENKGGRVCLIFIGMEQAELEKTYRQYGFDSMDVMRFLAGNQSRGIPLDLAALEEMLPEILENYDSIAISQFQARENDGAFEKEVKKYILEKKDLPIVCAYEIFKDLNVIKRGAGALLNARLIPVMQDFFRAIRKVLQEERMNLPFLIMRSDGSLVSEQYSMQFPVETLLCGPTASAKGARALMDERNAIVIDMGGTTSDIAMISAGELMMNETGVRVGDWETFVKGIEIDTFALGGDSYVTYKGLDPVLGERRVIPFSSLGYRWPQVLEELKMLSLRETGHTRPIYEHFVLMHTVEENQHYYTERELQIVEALKDGPLSMRQLADAIGVDVFTLKTERLEQEDVIERAAFTPTDAMVLNGDFTGTQFSREAAEYAAKFFELSTGVGREALIHRVYEMVERRLYLNLVRIMWKHAPNGQDRRTREDMQKVIMAFADESFSNEIGEQPTEVTLFANTFTTESVLIGVGAPTHVFLPTVAKALHTTCRISEYSAVANALGAVLGDVSAYETIHIGVANDAETSEEEAPAYGYLVYTKNKKVFENIEEAVAYAKESAQQIAVEKAHACGAGEIYEVTYQVKSRRARANYGGDIILGAEVTACARGKYAF